MKPKKTSIGECDCPLKGCNEKIPVYRYAGSDEPARRRFAGRLYGICPAHGRIENSEYFLCHAKLKSPSPGEEPAEEKSPPLSEGPPKQPTPQRQPSQKPTQAAKPSFFDKWSPIIR